MGTSKSPAGAAQAPMEELTTSTFSHSDRNMHVTVEATGGLHVHAEHGGARAARP